MNFKRIFLYTLIASTVLSAVIGIGVILFGDFGQFEVRVLMTTLTVTAASILGLACGAYFESGRNKILPITARSLGATIGFLYNKWARSAPNPAFAERLGVLMATGLIVGESLFGVVFAAIVGATDSDTPLSLVPVSGPGSVFIGLELFAVAIAWLYFKTRREASAKLANELFVEPPPQAAPR